MAMPVVRAVLEQFLLSFLRKSCDQFGVSERKLPLSEISLALVDQVRKFQPAKNDLFGLGKLRSDICDSVRPRKIAFMNGALIEQVPVRESLVEWRHVNALEV